MPPRDPADEVEAPVFEGDLDWTPEEFRRLAGLAVDKAARFYEGLRDAPVYSREPRAAIRAKIKGRIPKAGAPMEQVLEEWDRVVLPGATLSSSPRFFGFVNGSGTMPSVLADLLASAVNMNLGAWKASPSASEIEAQAIDWLRELVGYPETAGGQLLTGGMMGNYTALLVALRETVGLRVRDEGLSRNGYVIYMSDHEGHVTVERAADMLNLGRHAVHRVRSTSDFRLDPKALEEAIGADRAAGRIPFCVVAQAGSVNVGAVDPMEDIARVCKQEGLWLHVDGACGAFGAAIPETAHLFKGMERADSITLDPHKWMFVSYDCGALLVRDSQALVRAFASSASYLKDPGETSEVGPSFLETGPMSSRGFRALRLWMTVKHFGVDGYLRLWRQGIANAAYMDRLVRSDPDFVPIHEPTLFIYSFRCWPAAWGPYAQASDRRRQAGDRLNEEIALRVQRGGLAYVTTTKVHGRAALRMSFCSHRTAPGDVLRVFKAIREAGRECGAELAG